MKRVTLMEIILINCLFLISFSPACDSVKECCEFGGKIDPLFHTCVGGGPTRFKCEGSTSLQVLDPGREPSHKYFVEGDRLITAYLSVNSENFCESWTRNATYQKSRKIAMVCETFVLSYIELEVSYGLSEILGFVGCFLLFLTAFIYHVVPELHDAQGVCVFHCTLMMALSYAQACVLRDMHLVWDFHLCFSYAYFFYFTKLSFYFWLHLLSFCTWKSTTKISIRESREIIAYRTVGYGIPAVLICAAMSVAHSNGLYNVPSNEIICWVHQAKSVMFFLTIPIVLLYLGNIFYMLDTMRRLWNLDSAGGRQSFLRISKNRFSRFAKLYVLTGLILLLEVIVRTIFEDQIILVDVISVISEGQGIFIFIILVWTRKRAIRGLAKRDIWLISRLVPTKWSDMSNSEDTTDVAVAQPPQPDDKPAQNQPDVVDQV